MFGGNPVFNSKAVENAATDMTQAMTINGTIMKTLLLLLVAFIGAGATIYELLVGHVDKVMIIATTAFFVGFILAFVIIFIPKTAPYLSPIYAFAEGSLLGAITMMFEAKYPGIAINAIGLTFLSLFSMLALYRMNLVRATAKFRQTIIISMFAILGLYLINFIGGFFNFQIPMINSSGPIGIAFSLIVVAIASFSFIIDFDNIETGARNFMPKLFEWYFAFGLMVTLVWLYLEILRLLSKLANRN